MTITIPPSTASYTLSASGTTASNAGTRGKFVNGQPVGVYITGSNDTLVNSGTIIGGYNNSGSGLLAGVAVRTATGDSVTNQVGGLIENTYSIAAGILFYTTAGNVTNAGTIIGGVGSTGASGDGIDLDGGGSVTNLSTGTISGGGIYFGAKGIAGTVTNSGKILGDGVYGGVYMKAGGTVTNLAGTIAANGASYGIKISGGAGTVTNAATITGGSPGGSAIILSAVAGNRIIDQTGGVFIGTINGGSNATMELASSASAGTLTATGAQFADFSALYFDAGARWTIKGDSGLSTEFSRIGGFTVGDTISLSGLSQTPTTFSSSTAVVSGTTTTSVIIKAGSTGLETLTLLGSIASSSFSFVAGATSTLTELVQPPSITGISPDAGISSTDGITDTGTLTVNGTAVAGTTITLFNGGAQFSPTAVTTGGGTWSITLGTPLSAGNYTLTATATQSGVASSPSAGFAVDVDATAPSITSDSPASSSPNNASSDQFTVVFSKSVFGVGTSSFSLTDTGTASGSIASVSGSGTTYTVTVGSVTGNGTLRLDLKGPGSNGIEDTAGNLPAAYTSGTSYTVEHTPPSVSSINTVGGSPNNASSDQFSVAFADFLGAVSGVSASSFQLAATGTASGTIASVSGSGDSYTVTVNGVTGDGTLGLNLKSSGTGISDAAGNAPTAGFTGQTYTVEHTPPSVSSITTVGGSPNNASSDQFTVAFADFLGAVSGVSASSFQLAATGTASGTIASVSGSGDSYTVTVNGVTGDGTLGLNLKSSGTGISDAAGNAPTAGFTGQTYTVEHTPPSVSSINTVGGSPNNASSDQFTVAFADFLGAVSGVSTSSFQLATTGTASGTIASVSGSGDSYTVTVNGVTGDGTLGLNLKSSGTGISDAAGNAPIAGFTGQTYTVEHTPPSVSSINTVGGSPNNAASEQFTVAFADFLGAVSGVSTSSFQLAETGTASGTIASVSGSGDSYTVAVNGVTGDGTLGLNLKSSGTGISDAAGNAPSAGFTGQTYAVEHTPPSVSSINTVGGSSNNGGTEQFTVAFSEAVSGVTTAAFALADTGSVTGTIASISGGGSSYTVTVTGATGTGTMRLDLKSSATGIADAAGNAISGGFISGQTFSISPASGTPSIAAPATATVGVGRANQAGTVTISENPTSGGEAFTLTVSDTTGTLSANTGATNGGGTITPSNGTKTLTISGTLLQVNADLTTLTDNEPTTASDTLSYTLSDSNGGTANPAATTIGVNGLPTISAPGSAGVAQNFATAVGPIIVGETGNTTTGGETFSIVVSDGAEVLSANTGATNGGGTITPSNGNQTLTIAGTLLQVNADLTTMTDNDASAATDTITVHVNDSFGNSDATDASIPVTVSSFPELTQTTIDLTVVQGTSLGNLWSELIANGIDPNPGSLSIVSVGTSGTQGLVALNTGADSLTYLATGLNPASPIDVFTYTLEDGLGGTVSGTVDVTVTGPNLPTTVATTPGSITTATGSGQRLISEGSGQTLIGSPAGGDQLFGGPDTAITGQGSGNTIDVEPGNHTIAMGANNNSLTLNNGNNTVVASGTGNTVTGGSGNNSISGMTGNATITLGNGNDTVTVSGANNTITAGTGTDKITAGNGGNETVVAGDGTNTITGGGPNDSFTTGNGVSKITATGAGATITAGNGGDTITATGAGDSITTGSGNDSITVTVGSAIIRAGLGSNTIRFAGSNNDIVNQGGTDTLTDTGTNNTIVVPLAGQGLDTINGSVLTNGDTFDLRGALAATTWDQQSSDIGSYLTVGASGANALLQISVTSGGTPITVAVLNGAGAVSLSNLLTHTLLT